MTLIDIADDHLIERARQAAEAAYAPYSRFRVGAAVRDVDGRIFTGCNIENASYGLTICAERVAVFRAVAEGAKQFDALVVYTPTPRPTAPCGACRQVLFEFGAGMAIVCVCDGSDRIVTTLRDLLPAAFGPASLDVKQLIGLPENE
jgi:cytidine deaminase